jgi:hypothetical protein
MHEALHPQIIAHLDEQVEEKTSEKNTLKISGWAAHRLEGCKCIRAIYVIDGEIREHVLESLNRHDVSAFYGVDDLYNKSGWSIELDINASQIVLQMELNINEWSTFMHLHSNDINHVLKPTTRQVPTFLVYDNFYADPDTVRNYALGQEFIPHIKQHKGSRTEKVFKPTIIKEKFENLLNCKIKNWDHYPVNGCFQFCVAEDKLVYHFDTQQYAGIIYLTPDAPPASGTSFLRSRHNKLMKIDDNAVFKETGKTLDELHGETFPTGFYDSSQFDVVDVVGNIYNRLVIWDAKLIHAATSYFGNNKENSRLFHLFFFDLDI